MMTRSMEVDLTSKPPGHIGIGTSQKLAANDYCFLESEKFVQQSSIDDIAQDSIDAFIRSWDDLQLDAHMADGGKYRLRRHATLTAEPGGGPIRLEAHQPHFQKVSYNPLNGGVQRNFEPISPTTIDNPVMQAILRFGSEVFGALAPFNRWHVEAHQFRIDAVPDGGKPTPEGVHRDGVHFVLMTLIARSNVVNGETSIHDLDGNRLTSFTLMKPFDSALVNDERVAHGVTPIMRLDPEQRGYRDVLVVTFRRK